MLHTEPLNVWFEESIWKTRALFTKVWKNLHEIMYLCICLSVRFVLKVSHMMVVWNVFQSTWDI